MAKNKPKMPFSRASHDKLVVYAQLMAKRQDKFTEFKAKLETIDKAYYTFKAIKETCTVEEKAELEAALETPMVISHVDSTVAYQSDIFLSGYPIFGVVTSKDAVEAGEQMEALIASHSTMGKWTQEILRFLLDGAKYNFHGLEVAWAPHRNIAIAVDTSTVGSTPEATTSFEYINSLKAPDMYNLFWDYAVDPVSVSAKGDYIGYHEELTRIALMELIEELEDSSGEFAGAINVKDALDSSYPAHEYFTERPTVADYKPSDEADSIDWLAWIGQSTEANSRSRKHSNSYLVTTMYVRIIPDDFNIIRPGSNKVQVFKLKLVNMSHIIHISAVYTPNNALPIYMGQPLEDGFGYQTKSLSEVILPWQDAASELLNARLASSRRAISDRAIYDPNYLTARDVNSRNPSAKIPLKQSFRLDNVSASQVYHQIPFESSGTQALLGDMQGIMRIADDSTGQNQMQRGNPMKGNRTLGEFQAVAGNSDGRARSLALRIESQVMTSIKLQIKINILMYAAKGDMLSPTTSKQLAIDPDLLRRSIIEFKLADGYTPKSKMVNPESFNMMLQSISANPAILQDPNMFDLYAFFGNLIGVPNMSQFRPTAQPGLPAPAQTPEGGAPNGASQQPAV